MQEAAIRIEVKEAVVKVSGLQALQLNDLYAEAPEPAPPGFGALRATSSNLLYLAEKLPEADWFDPKRRLLEAQAHALITSARSQEPTDYDRAWPFKLPPIPFQLKIFAVARLLPYISLAPVVAGGGKSKIMIDIGADKFMRQEIDAIAVVASPKGVHRQWVEEALPTHMTDAVKWKAHIWSSTKKVPPDMLKAGKLLRVMTFSVSAFSTEGGRAEKDLKAFLKSGRVLLIEDESSRIKNYKANRTKAMLRLAPLATVRAILTGTPITKGIENLYTQYDFLSPLILGMSNYFAFRGRYCVTVPAFRGAAMGVVKIVGYRNMEEFVKKIAPCTFVVPEDVLGLPEQTMIEIPVELTPEQKHIYNAIRKKLVDELKAGAIASPVNAAVRWMRLQQVLSGIVHEDLGNGALAIKRIPSNRIATLIEWCDANPGPKVVWARFQLDIDEIAAALKKEGLTVVTYDGRTSDKLRVEYKKRFMNGDAEYFVANGSTAGMGLDGLQHATSTSLSYSNDFNRETRWQSLKRIKRLGVRGTSLHGDLVADKTIDRTILDSYKTTEDLVNTLMSHPDLVPILN